MFELVQQKSLLLGTSDAIRDLAHKKAARILALSDSHGDTEMVHTIIKHCGASCDALCFCGDGARDVLTVLASSVHDADFAACIPPVVSLVQGNGDNASYAVQVHHNTASFGVPKTHLFVAAGNIVFVTHGHWHDVYYGTTELFHAAKRERATVALFGHTHIPYATTEDGILLLNPGSCARPRRSSPNSFAVVTIAERGTTYQFYAIEDAYTNARFSEYEPPHEEISLLWQ